MGSKNVRLSPNTVKEYRGRIPELMESLGLPRGAKLELIEYNDETRSPVGNRPDDETGWLFRISHQDIKDAALP